MAGRLGTIGANQPQQASAPSVSSGGRLGKIQPKVSQPSYEMPSAPYPVQQETPQKSGGLMGFLGDIGGGILKGGAGAIGSVGSLISSAVTGSAENNFTKGLKKYQEGIKSGGIGDFIGNLPGGIVSGLVDPASYMVRGARNTPEMVAASIAAGSSDKNIRQEGIKTQKELQNKLFGKEVTAQGDKGMLLEGLAQPASAILNVATGGIAGSAKQVGKQVVKQGLKDVAKTALKAGAVNVAAGTPISVAQQLARGQEVTPESVAKDAITQGLLGAVIAGVPKAIHIKAANRLADLKATQNLGENVIPKLTDEQMKSMTPQQIKVATTPDTSKVGVNVSQKMSDVDYVKEFNSISKDYETDVKKMQEYNPARQKLAQDAIDEKYQARLQELDDKFTNGITKKVGGDIETVKANVEKDLGIKLTDNQAASIAENAPKAPQETKLPEVTKGEVVQVKDTNNGKVTYYEIPKNGRDEIVKAIDGNQNSLTNPNGVAGKPIDGKIYHITARDINDPMLVGDRAGIFNPAEHTPTNDIAITPETAVSGRALSTEQEAITQGLTTGIEDKSKYATTSYKENKITAEELVKNNKQGALDIIEGRSEASNPQIQETYKQLLKYAKENKDLDVYERLVRSDVAEKALSESAQTLGAAGFEADPSNPVARVREVKKALEAKASKRTTETKAKVTKAISGEVDKVLKVSENKSWNSFLEGIRC